MKKVLLILLVAVTALISCKKDPEEKLKGRWDLIKRYSTEHIDNIMSHESNETFNVGEMYVVFENNKYNLYENGKLDGSGTFTATSNSITLTEENGLNYTNTIKWNSKNEFVMSSEDTTTFNGQTYHSKEEATLRKH